VRAGSGSQAATRDASAAPGDGATAYQRDGMSLHAHSGAAPPRRPGGQRRRFRFSGERGGRRDQTKLRSVSRPSVSSATVRSCAVQAMSSRLQDSTGPWV